MKTTNITTQTAVNSSLKPRRRIIAKKDNVIQMKESQLKQLKKAYSLEALKMLQVDYKTKRNKYVSKKQIKLLINKILNKS